MKTIFLPLILSLLIALCSCGSISSQSKKNEGNKIVAKIELFKKENGRLPSSLSELGIKETEEGPIYYEKKDNSSYILWFGAELGESVTFNSSTNKWSK
jgi:hypothetical protein